MLSLCKKYLILLLAIPLSWCVTMETGVAQTLFTPQVGPIIAIGTPDSQNPTKATLSVWSNSKGLFSILLDFTNGISCGIFNGVDFQSLK